MRIYIDSADLPAATVIDRDGVPHISVEGSETGTWKASGNHAQARQWGLEYLAAAQAMEAWQASPAAAAHKRMQRRNELARELAGEGFSRTTYDTVSCVAKNAIDRIIELEGK